jgi:hypothetical protein
MSETFHTLKNKFPNIKLSYETIIHKKVLNANFITLVPQGVKCFIWFTFYNDKPSCFIVKNNKKQLYFTQTNCCFDKQLCYNTIFYGTILKIKDGLFFTAEDIFYYKGNDISHSNWHDKLVTFKNIFKTEIKNINYNLNFLHIGLPILCKHVNEVSKLLSSQPYKIECIRFHLFNKVSSYLVLDASKFDLKFENKSKLSNIVFAIRADIQNDIYQLYYLNGDILEFYENAFIPSYEKSVIMNNLFRTIKENVNLDHLEESDDEYEFQNENTDKFVDLNKTINMECSFHFKFKKWIPIKVSDEALIQKEKLSLYKK